MRRRPPCCCRPAVPPAHSRCSAPGQASLTRLRPFALASGIPLERILLLDMRSSDAEEDVKKWREEVSVAVEQGSFIRPRILVSACLAGHPVTYRGKPSGWAEKASSQRSSLGFLLNILCTRLQVVECVPCCPEMQLLKLTAPRHPIRLVERAEDAGGRAARFVLDTASGKHMWSYDENKLLRVPRKSGERRQPAYLVPTGGSPATPEAAAHEDVKEWLSRVDGAVVKAKSPSCGLGDAKMFGTDKEQATASMAQVDGFFVKMIRDELRRGSPDTAPFPIHSEKTLQRLSAAHPETADGRPGVALAPLLYDLLVHAAWRANAALRP